MIDTGKETYSLCILLKEMQKHRSVLTRERYVQGWPEGMRDRGESDWDEHFDDGTGQLRESFLEGHLKSIEDIHGNIMRVINKRILHNQRGEINLPEVKWQDLHDAVNTIHEIAFACHLLFRQTNRQYLPISRQIDRDLIEIWGGPPKENNPS